MLVRLLLIALGLYVAYRIVRALFSSKAGSQLPCATCRNCKALFDDGAICMFGSKETFKTEAHIANCNDYERGRAS